MRVSAGSIHSTLPPVMRRGIKGLGQSVCLATNGAGNCTCPLEDAPLGCSPAGIPWQASGGGPANNWIYYDIITGQPLDLSNACYINEDLLINCDDNENGQQPAGPITILAQTAAYAAANAAANAAYVPPPPPASAAINPITGNETADVVSGNSTATSIVAKLPTVSLLNTTAPNQPFQVGDSWSLQINGAPNSPVTDTASQNGASLGTTSYGSTDSNGNLFLSGTFDSSTVGTWVETWSVGGISAGPISFTVSPAPTQVYGGGSSTTGGSSTGSSGSTNSGGSTSTTQTTTTCFQPLAQFGIPDQCLDGLPIGIGTLVAGAVLLFVLLGSKR